MIKNISNYFCDLAQSKDRILKIFYDAALPGAVVGLFTTSPKIALSTAGLLLVHGVIRDAVSVENTQRIKPTPN